MENIKKRNSLFFHQLMLIVLIAGMGALIFWKLGYLLGSILGAVTIYAILRKPLFYLTEKRKWKSWLVSLLLVFATVVVLILLAFLIFEMVAAQIPALNGEKILNELIILVSKINEELGFTLISKNLIMESRGMLTNVASGIVNSTYNVTLNLFLMIIVLYFMLARARDFERSILKYLPFEGNSLTMIKLEVKNMVYSNAVGIPVIMFAQAIVAIIGYWIVGLDRIVFWAFLTALFGLIPVIGTAAIWLPLGVYLIAVGSIWQGVFLLVFGALIISSADNACRMILLKVMANIHPLIVIFGVMLGIPLFGFWGIIFGPLLISGFLLLIKIYSMEYRGTELHPYQAPRKRKKEKG